MRHRPRKSVEGDEARPARNSGFTLVELVVSVGVLTLILVLTLAATDGVSKISKRTRARIDTFQEARAGFEVMTRKLSQAMLNTYWDYQFPNNDRSKMPNAYVRQSELHFISGPMKTGTAPLPLVPSNTIQSASHGLFFVSPQGYSSPPVGTVSRSAANLENLLNANGYFVEYSSDRTDRPKFLVAGATDRWRFRLMEFIQPTENLQVYRWPSPTETTVTPYSWFRDPLASEPTSRRVLAENVVALVLWPRRSPNDPVPAGAQRQLAPNYLYDSRLHATIASHPLAALTRNQLPPIVQVTMVAIDEGSAGRLQDQTSPVSVIPSARLGLPDLFKEPSVAPNPGPGEEGDQYRLDLEALAKKLAELKLTYRIFSTEVSILQAKWSEN